MSTYAKTNHFEDLAESYEAFHRYPGLLKSRAPEKFEDMKRFNQQDFLENLVDRREFRETGKLIGEWMGPNEMTRHSLEAAHHASSLLGLGHGIYQTFFSEDPMSQSSGLLSAISSGLLFSGVSPTLGIATQGANQALQSAVSRGVLRAEDVSRTLFIADAPKRSGRVASVAVGGGLGVAAGGIAGPYLGVLAGYHLAGPLGGVVGMISGSLAGFYGGAEVGGRLANLFADAAGWD